MKINEAGLQIIKDAEAGEGIMARWPADHPRWPNRFKYLTAYMCPADVPTIGWGHTGPDVTADDVALGTTISVQKAMQLLAEDLEKFEAGVERLMTRKPTANQFSAFVSLGFNIGLGQDGLAGSTALRRHNKGDTDARVAEAMQWWNKGTVNGRKQVLSGLVLRRGREASLYMTKDGFSTPKPVGSTPVHEAKPPSVGRLIVAAASAVTRAA